MSQETRAVPDTQWPSAPTEQKYLHVFISGENFAIAGHFHETERQNQVFKESLSIPHKGNDAMNQLRLGAGSQAQSYPC